MLDLVQDSKDRRHTEFFLVQISPAATPNGWFSNARAELVHPAPVLCNRDGMLVSKVPDSIKQLLKKIQFVAPTELILIDFKFCTLGFG